MIISKYIDDFSLYNRSVGHVVGCSLFYEMSSRRSYVANWWPNRPPFWPPPHWIKKIEDRISTITL